MESALSRSRSTRSAVFANPYREKRTIDIASTRGWDRLHVIVDLDVDFTAQARPHRIVWFGRTHLRVVAIPTQTTD